MSLQDKPRAHLYIDGMTWTTLCGATSNKKFYYQWYTSGNYKNRNWGNKYDPCPKCVEKLSYHLLMEL